MKKETVTLVDLKGEFVKEIEINVYENTPQLIVFEGKQYLFNGDNYIEMIPYIVPFNDVSK